MTKILALYLPQFHTIPENDNWWGEGFTEWVNVKKAKRLFDDHEQPKVPLNNNYYDLSEVDTLFWQAKLAQQYKVDGFVFYHYWFGGKLLLEKPIDILLANPDINMPFCISWANEPWTRSWDGRTKDVIMPQEYGSEREWDEHIKYLIKAFKDDRYIKDSNGKPILIIYRAENIPNFDIMIKYWQNKLSSLNLPNITIIATNSAFKDENDITMYQSRFNFEPFCSFNNNKSLSKRIETAIRVRLSKIIKLFNGRGIVNNVQSYDDVWKEILKRPVEEDTYLGGFVNWDNTPRKKEKGMVFKGFSPEKFEKYLGIQYERSMKYDKEFLFLNAWNEWAEGTYLEPDIMYEYRCLEAISNVKNSYVS